VSAITASLIRDSPLKSPESCVNGADRMSCLNQGAQLEMERVKEGLRSVTKAGEIIPTRWGFRLASRRVAMTEIWNVDCSCDPEV
jgi:hypothetical protein